MKKRVLLLCTIFSLVLSSNLIAEQYELDDVYLIELKEDRYIIHFKLPEFWIEYEEDSEDDSDEILEDGTDDNCGILNIIEMDADYDVLDVPGYPQLPFFTLHLLLPDSAQNIEVKFNPIEQGREDLPCYISAAQRGGHMECNSFGYPYQVNSELEEECYNGIYYDNGIDDSYPDGFYRNFFEVTTPYRLYNNGAQGVTLSIYPFAYYPEQFYMDVLRYATFEIKYDRGSVLNTMAQYANGTDAFSMVTKTFFDTFCMVDITSSNTEHTKGTLLIVAESEEMETCLQPYVDYKSSLGYDVEVAYLDYHNYNALGDPYMIYDIINNRASSPDYVLLVGSLYSIPPYKGTSDDDNPYTDDSYHPHLGRWIVHSYSELSLIIEKTMSSEDSYSLENTQAVLFSGRDDKKRISKKFYKRIAKIDEVAFRPLGISSTLYDGRKSDINFETMQEALQGNPNFFIYSGHGLDGGITSGLCEPYCVIPDGFSALGYRWISDFGNATPYPMGFGFACVLNSYKNDDSFGARWVSECEGGVAFYGATTTSYSTSNYYLAKRLFRKLRDLTCKLGELPISVWLRVGEESYYRALRTSTRARQVERYSLIGDPTLLVYGFEDVRRRAPSGVGANKMDRGQDVLSVNNEVSKIAVYDICGRCVMVHSSNITRDELVNMLPRGLYIVEYTYIDGQKDTIKMNY